jgi:hypothetical protein
MHAPAALVFTSVRNMAWQSGWFHHKPKPLFHIPFRLVLNHTDRSSGAAPRASISVISILLHWCLIEHFARHPEGECSRIASV